MAKIAPGSSALVGRFAAARSARRGLAAATLALIGFFALGGCSGGVLDPQGPIGAAQRTILLNSVAIMLVIVVPTIVAALGFAWWFRSSNSKARHRPDWAYSGRIEAIVWVIPALVVLFLGGIAWISSHDLDPAQPIASPSAPLEIQVVSLDWKWLFIYPEQGVASVDRLVLPTGVPVHFKLTSASVMNAFFVPQLGSMIYTMNGMTTQLYLQADQAGTFHGQSSQFSGAGFSDMHFQVHALPPPQFATWVESVRGSGPVLDRAAYAALARQGVAARPFSYGAVQPDLFQAVVVQAVPPASGPGVSHPDLASAPRTER
jgi:cytochrome o ubiquinol oxidase subunit 2